MVWQWCEFPRQRPHISKNKLMRQMITPEQARQIVLEETCTLTTQTIVHSEALGRVLAQDIVSDLELPPFDNSAMDGYAVVAEEVQNANATRPASLRLLETIGAGGVGTQRVERGNCIKIMTGAPVPEGADAVVMREETQEENDIVHFFAPARPRQNIRPRGDDVKIGEKVLESGTLIGPAQWAMLASLGRAQVEVFRAPRVGIIATGEELVDVDATLLPGQIRDSNSFALEGLCREAGATVERIRIGDDVQTARETIEAFAKQFDCVITSGGVSAGDFDPIRDALLQLQEAGTAQIHFWKIAMKPGKPVMFASLENSEGLSNSKNPPPTPLFGLPGNPVSVMVAFEQFVRPALLKMQGRSAQRRTVNAAVQAPFKSPGGKVEFVRVQVSQSGDSWQADVTGDQGSGRLSTMTRANALLVVPAEVTQVAAGQILPAQLTDS